MENVMEAFFRCLISRGLFSDEVAARGKTASGAEFSMFVPKEFVNFDEPVPDVGAVEGWLRVEVLSREGALMLVRLPGEPFENGRNVTVRDSEVEIRPRHETV
jgi:hypothetical protein